MMSKVELCLGDSVTVYTPLGTISIHTSEYERYDLVIIDVYQLAIGTTVKNKDINKPGAYVQLERNK